MEESILMEKGKNCSLLGSRSLSLMITIILQLILYLILVTFDCLCRCALSDEGASRLTDVHDNSEEVMSSLILQVAHHQKISPSPTLQIGGVFFIDVDQGSLINEKI